MINRPNLGYRICKAESGWAWAAFDRHGALQEEGLAPTRAVAAALVIRHLTRQAEPSARSAA